MYRQNKPQSTSLTRNESYYGETIEQKIHRIINNKEPLTDGAPLIYTDRKDGVLPEYDPRTDRFEIAIDAMDKVTASKQAAREQRHREKEEAKVIKLDKKDGGAEPIQGTESK